MIIRFSPQRRDDVLVVSKAGDVLTINGEAFDFSVVTEGATLPAEAVGSDFVTGAVERVGGELRLTLVLPHGANPPHGVAFPDALIGPPDGTIQLPGGANG